jgi:hypothetical protein
MRDGLRRTPIAQPDMRAVKRKRGWRYRLFAEYIYEWTYAGVRYRLVVPEGFECDGASIPWWVKVLTGLERDGLHRPAWTLHDVVYHYVGDLPEGMLQVWVEGEWRPWVGRWSRRDADRLFGRVMRESGVPSKERRRMYNGVRVGGWLPWWTRKIELELRRPPIVGL